MNIEFFFIFLIIIVVSVALYIKLIKNGPAIQQMQAIGSRLPEYVEPLIVAAAPSTQGLIAATTAIVPTAASQQELIVVPTPIQTPMPAATAPVSIVISPPEPVTPLPQQVVVPPPQPELTPIVQQPIIVTTMTRVPRTIALSQDALNTIQAGVQNVYNEYAQNFGQTVAAAAAQLERIIAINDTLRRMFGVVDTTVITPADMPEIDRRVDEITTMTPANFPNDENYIQRSQAAMREYATRLAAARRTSDLMDDIISLVNYSGTAPPALTAPTTQSINPEVVQSAAQNTFNIFINNGASTNVAAAAAQLTRIVATNIEFNRVYGPVNVNTALSAEDSSEINNRVAHIRAVTPDTVDNSMIANAENAMRSYATRLVLARLNNITIQDTLGLQNYKLVASTLPMERDMSNVPSGFSRVPNLTIDWSNLPILYRYGDGYDSIVTASNNCIRDPNCKWGLMNIGMGAGGYFGELPDGKTWISTNDPIAVDFIKDRMINIPSAGATAGMATTIQAAQNLATAATTSMATTTQSAQNLVAAANTAFGRLRATRQF